MPVKIDFFFDFSSSYSYVSLPGILQLADQFDVTIQWKPFLLGVIFKARNHAPPSHDDLKSQYMAVDLKRRAVSAGLPPFRTPSPFPFNAITAMRAFWHLHASDPDIAIAWAKAVFDASFAKGLDSSQPETLAAIATDLGLNAEQLFQASADPVVKDKLKAVTGEAMERGVFGAPTFFVGDEMFWGGDRLADIERHLSGA